MKTEVSDEIYVSVILTAVEFAEMCVTSSGFDNEFRK
jgi:hypothetical protein